MPAGHDVPEVPRRKRAPVTVQLDRPDVEVHKDREGAFDRDRRTARVVELEDGPRGAQADVAQLEILLFHDDVGVAGF